MNARGELHEAICGDGCGVAKRCERTDRLIDAHDHELVDWARRGVDVLEGHVGGFQYSRDVREILDVVDPVTPSPDGWNFE